VNVAIVVAGVVGLAVAAFFFGELVIDAGRRRQVLDIAVAVAVVVATVWLLLVYGDALLQ
jgi:threonine/homoserine efflux transporter RhtA